jgi:hypothetical protein
MIDRRRNRGGYTDFDIAKIVDAVVTLRVATEHKHRFNFDAAGRGWDEIIQLVEEYRARQKQ